MSLLVDGSFFIRSESNCTLIKCHSKCPELETSLRKYSPLSRLTENGSSQANYWQSICFRKDLLSFSDTAAAQLHAPINAGLIQGSQIAAHRFSESGNHRSCNFIDFIQVPIFKIEKLKFATLQKGKEEALLFSD